MNPKLVLLGTLFLKEDISDMWKLRESVFKHVSKNEPYYEAHIWFLEKNMIGHLSGNVYYDTKGKYERLPPRIDW
jgi:hypothetical protein